MIISRYSGLNNDQIMKMGVRFFNRNLHTESWELFKRLDLHFGSLEGTPVEPLPLALFRLD